MLRPMQAYYGDPNKRDGGQRDLRLLPRRIVLVRHAQSKGNVDPFQYTYVPDPSVPLTSKGWEQAIAAGEQLRAVLAQDAPPGSHPLRAFFYTSPYLRCKQTTEGLLQAFRSEEVLGVQEEVQLREQDFGNFQDAEGKKRKKLECLRYGRFFYRFPHGESGADVYDRMTIFEDHLVRDMDAGRYGENCSLVLVTHGLAARIFLHRWLHWTVEQFLAVWNPGNAEPIVLERVPDSELAPHAVLRMHTKALYRLTPDSKARLTGCTDDMCSTSWTSRGLHFGSMVQCVLGGGEDGDPQADGASQEGAGEPCEG
ncbi:phosphoglycerate mutase [Micractinium conductrix]|uniref:Phosphoglycerate mutase n=1 Tax=Micractinium conductrix TaxID=554055 RepID=A0A2P6V6V5_9CHLO|nr:phosphoglycerate mutase [Micractinium conductrix]|eukprot:PSC69817.1 phosphoglycerate mutase [Micractinium conductrix]